MSFLYDEFEDYITRCVILLFYFGISFGIWFQEVDHVTFVAVTEDLNVLLSVVLNSVKDENASDVNAIDVDVIIDTSMQISFY